MAGKRRFITIHLVCGITLALAPAAAAAGTGGISAALSPGRLKVEVNPPAGAREAAVYVDRRSHLVAPNGYLRAGGLRVGRHVLTTDFVCANGTVVRSTRIAHLSRGPRGGQRWRVAPAPSAKASTEASCGQAPQSAAGQAPRDHGAPDHMVGPLLGGATAPAPPPPPAPPPQSPEPGPAPQPGPGPEQAPAPEPPPTPAPEPEPGPEPPPPPPVPEPEREPAPEPPPPQPAPEPPPLPSPEPFPTPEPEPGPEPPAPTFIEAGFEHGLSGWSTAGVGEVVPTVVEDIVETGKKSGRVVLTGSENRSELILAEKQTIAEFPVGTERWYAFSFNVLSMVYGHPGAHNLIMQLKSNNEGSPMLGLQLWDYAGDDGHSGGRGLWTSGEAMGGDRFLAPISEHQWHDVLVHFKVTQGDTGFYQIYLDGSLVDSRTGISVLREGAETAYIKSGLYRNGEEIPGLSEIRLDSAALGTSREEVTPPPAA
ncbi:MAG TPA: heparin lyase I family protein [Solirubrobacterales bacterium]